MRVDLGDYSGSSLSRHESQKSKDSDSGTKSCNSAGSSLESD
jgi:hypothetical protein